MRWFPYFFSFLKGMCSTKKKREKEKRNVISYLFSIEAMNGPPTKSNGEVACYRGHFEELISGIHL